MDPRMSKKMKAQKVLKMSKKQKAKKAKMDLQMSKKKMAKKTSKKQKVKMEEAAKIIPSPPSKKAEKVLNTSKKKEEKMEDVIIPPPPSSKKAEKVLSTLEKEEKLKMDLEKHEKVLMEYVMRSEEMEKKEEEEDDDEMPDMIYEMSPERKKKKKKREWKDIVISKEIMDLFPASFYPNTTIHPSRFLKKKAVLIGLKPPNNAAADVDVKQQILRMKDQLIKLRGFTEEGITLMIEDDENSIRPTATNIRIKLCWLTENTNPGDIVFVHLIAYGCMEGFICTADRHHISGTYIHTLWIGLVLDWLIYDDIAFAAAAAAAAFAGS